MEYKITFDHELNETSQRWPRGKQIAMFLNISLCGEVVSSKINLGQRSHRAGSSPPPQSNSFVNIDDGVSNTNFRFNEAIVYHVTSNLCCQGLVQTYNQLQSSGFKIFRSYKLLILSQNLCEVVEFKGETARVVVRSGDIYEGILRAVSSKFDCVLGEAHLVAQKKPANGLIEDERILPNRDRLINNILIALKDIVIINITKTEEPDSAIDRFTDEAIAGSRHANGQLAERQLQKWVPQEAEPVLGGGLEDNTQMVLSVMAVSFFVMGQKLTQFGSSDVEVEVGVKNGWTADEMFKTNQKKFGVTSTYSDALEEYTMPIPDGTREMELRAEQTAREIEQSCGHSRRQEVDSGCTEEEAFASVIRPKTTAQASRPTERQEVAADKSSPCATKEGSSTSTTATLSSATENKVSPDEDASQGSFVKSPAMSETSKVVQDLKDFSANFKLLNPIRTKDIPTEPETGEPAVASSKGNVDDSKTSKPPEDDILTTSKLNPLAKEFKFTPKSQPAQYVSVLPAQPFSPTPVRPPAVPYSQPVMMFNPQQLNPMYRGKPPHNKSRGQSYAVRDQESPPFISAAAATGSPIIAPGGTYPPQVYQLPPIAYVQSTGGMATQPMVQQYVTVPAGHPPARFIAPVSSPGSGPPVPMSQAYQDGSAMPVYGAATSPGQPQPSPSQQGQFIFASPVPPLPGQPQGAGHHQAQVAPGPTQFPPQPVVYIPNANVSSSAASAVSYIPGTYPADRIQ
ncbi:Ataxin-2-like protein [Acropora cervicornis]|uniref:Ataxin-2-like protein n=1 Tax=Acropora cervicornis TaxID=6130 RepID=A0AAD9VHV9_ACRCE|nr:Ataxin-2-like protein [Acropora cervicornis]